VKTRNKEKGARKPKVKNRKKGRAVLSHGVRRRTEGSNDGGKRSSSDMTGWGQISFLGS